MIKQKTIKTEKVITESVICDICKKEYSFDDEIKDNLELQEMTNIYINGGYSSIFGDGNNFYINICQHCLKKIIDHFNITINTY